MTSNHKLTAVLKGRTIRDMTHHDQTLSLVLEDGAQMTVKTSGALPKAAPRGTIAKVRQQDTQLALDLADGATIQIPLAAATASVMVRDKDHHLEYAD